MEDDESECDLVTLRSVATSSSSSAAGASQAEPANNKRARPSTSEDLVSAARSPLSVSGFFGKQTNDGSMAKLAAAFAAHSLSHRLVETAEFREFLASVGISQLPSRATMRSNILKQSQALRQKVVATLSAALTPLSLAADGWTNVRHDKVTNIVLLTGGKALYWASLVNADSKNSADWLAPRIAAHMRQLIREHSLRVVAFVADNEAVNGAVHRALLVDFPFLVHVPCAAHTIQLIVRDALAADPYQKCVRQFAELIRFFEVKQNRHTLIAVQRSKGLKQLCLLRPNDTRWSSMLRAVDRAVLLRPALECCFELVAIPDKAAFFADLAALAEFLRPFQVATDCIQRDDATLYDVYLQFVSLLQHVKRSPCVDAAASAYERWRGCINVDATVACCLLSFEEPAGGLDIAASQQFICDFGAKYLSHYGMATGTLEEIGDRLTLQLAEFFGHTGRFTLLFAAQLPSLRRSAAQFSPRIAWNLVSTCELAKVAVALLSIAASEAAVERTFSAQDAVHRKLRNRMTNELVAAEVFYKFNRRLLHESAESLADSRREPCVELTEAVDTSDCDTDVDLSTLFAPPAKPAAAARLAAAAAAAAADDDDVHAAEPAVPLRSNEEWLQQYVEKRGYHPWNREDEQLLTAAALQRTASTAPLPADLAAKARGLIRAGRPGQ